jgi:hypothetical protein
MISMNMRPPRPTAARKLDSPDGAEEAERDRDEEDEPPVDRGEKATEHEPDEHSADAGDVVDAEGEAALVGREGISENRRRVADQAGGTDALDHPEHHQPNRTGRSRHPVDGQQQGRARVDDEAEVVDAHPPDDVAEAPQPHHEHAADDEEAEDHPEQVEAVRRGERVQIDAAKDVGHRNQHDRGIDGGEQHPDCRVWRGRSTCSRHRACHDRW